MQSVYDRYDDAIRNRWKAGVFDENGNEVHDRIVPSRGIVKIPLVLMDGKTVEGHPAPFQRADRRPQFVTLDDAECERREKQYAAYDARISAAWKNPPASDGG